MDGSWNLDMSVALVRARKPGTLPPWTMNLYHESLQLTLAPSMHGSYATDELEEYQNELDGNGHGWNGDENQYVQQHDAIYYPVAESR
ncbi:hypothetical protein Tco_0497219 [Tanacetum coccineum]